MKEHNCQVVSKEELVAFADGDLSPGQAEQVTGHIAGCENCRPMADALERSLQVAQVIWRTGEAQWPKTLPLDKAKSSKRWLSPAATVAASILLISGIATTWRLMSKPSEQPQLIGKEPTAAEIEEAANSAALAAQMLAVAELLSSQPGGVQYAVERYNDVITSFPNTDQSSEAIRHLQRLSERR